MQLSYNTKLQTPKVQAKQKRSLQK